MHGNSNQELLTAKDEIKPDFNENTLYVAHKLLFNKSIWSIEDVALYLGLSKGTIYNKTSKGQLPHRKRGNRLYFIPLDIQNWVEEGDL